MRILFFIVTMLGLIVTTTVAYAEETVSLKPLEFLIGTWESSGGGQPGSAEGVARFSYSLQERVILRRSYAEYPATETTAASRHDDLMVIYISDDGRIRADYYDNEGHVIRYSITTESPGKATFVSDLVPNTTRFRLRYDLGADGILKGEFAMASPDKPEDFAPYLIWESHKVGTENDGSDN